MSEGLELTVKISELDDASGFSNGDVLPVVQSGETRKIPREVIFNSFVSNLGSAALASNEDFASASVVDEISEQVEQKANEQNERIERIEHAVYLIRNNGVFKAYRTKAQMLADAGIIPADSVVSVVADPANNAEINDINGQYHYNGNDFFKLPDNILLLVNEKINALTDKLNTELAYIDSIKVNSGKAFPLKSYKRNNVTSPANNYLLNCILKIRLVNAMPNKFYRLAYFKNGNVTIPGSLDGWIIEEFDQLNYETAANPAVRVITYEHPAPDIHKNGDIQTVKLQSGLRNEFQAYITLDTSKLPPVGTPIFSLNEGTSGWSWIIDPSCYEYPLQTMESELTINQGKQFPLRAMKRNNIESRFNSFLLNAILAVRVVGARKGSYYGIRYFKNGTDAVSGVPDGWIIEEQAIADYATSEAAAQVIALGNNSVPNIDRSKGIQTIILESPTVKSLRFHLTIDPSKFPPYGEFVRMNFQSNDGYSLIIDPTCYEYPVLLPENALTINQGKEYPNKKVKRENETSAANSFLLDCILDVKVLGAREGYFYGIRYFKNGTKALPGPDDGWIIEEQAILNYETSGVATRIISYTDPAPTIKRGGIQSLRLVSPRSDTEFLITLDTDKLPPYEAYISMLNLGSAGRSWIIDPSCYEYMKPIPAISNSANALSYSATSAGRMNLIWQSGIYLYRLRFGPNGYNNLPNIIGIDRAPLGDRNSAAWIQVNTASTDWLPPMVIEAINNGDGKSQIYTGGNHGADSGAGGGNTARNIHYQVLADGQPMEMNKPFSGNAQKISVQIINELMAHNTTGTVDPENFPSRYVLAQSFVVDIYCGSMEVSTEVKAYEPIQVKTDNGPQMVTLGYQQSMLYVGGQFEERLPFDNSTNSGRKTQYPNAWALVLQHTDNGQQVSWMDREYEIGDARYVGGNAAMIRGGGTTNTKFYHAAVAAPAQPYIMQTGDKYKWRGGYAWQAPNLQGGFDSTIVFHKNGKQTTAIIKTASDYAVL
ncbi:hypothetical protein PY247_18340 [Acinetobacter proteolyticus]|nr:hypothetical protein [Acinetobacter proteolyticus]WEI18204.1 hypothetical protein PY247_18340 [Acinetobacter proteolyticus]